MNTQLSSLLKSSGSAELEADEGYGERSGKGSRVSPRDWRARWAFALPWLLLIGFFLVLAAVFGKRLLPAKELTVVTVVTDRLSIEEKESPIEIVEGGKVLPVKEGPVVSFDGPMLFQASGWVEPDPLPTKATALVDGVVETVHVLEGDLVSKGEPLAKLIDEDVRLDLETSQSRLASLEAQVGAHKRQIEMAEAGIVTLSKQVESASARRDEAADVLQRLMKVSSGGVAEREISESRLRVATLEAEAEALAVTEVELKAKVGELNEILADFGARIKEAKTDVARKQLALDRTRIVSPIDGRILRLMVVPGQKRMMHADNMESATIAILYNPKELQARIDVPLAEAAQLEVGQAVRLRSEVLPGTDFRGRVTRIVGEADLQRNTLQVKVAIENPDERLRPEMLCRAEFLGAAPETRSGSERGQATGSASVARVTIFVPMNAFTGGTASEAAQQAEATVWRVDASGDHVTPQRITLGREVRGGFREVREGLKPGDRVVVNPPADLKSGDRFQTLTASADSQPSTDQ